MLFGQTVGWLARSGDSVNCGSCTDQILPRSAILSPVANRNLYSIAKVLARRFMRSTERWLTCIAATKRFFVGADERLAVFLELESAICSAIFSADLASEAQAARPKLVTAARLRALQKCFA